MLLTSRIVRGTVSSSVKWSMSCTADDAWCCSAAYVKANRALDEIRTTAAYPDTLVQLRANLNARIPFSSVLALSFLKSRQRKTQIVMYNAMRTVQLRPQTLAERDLQKANRAMAAMGVSRRLQTP